MPTESSDRRVRHVPTPPPLPVDADALIAGRVISFDRNINDLVDDAVKALFVGDEAFKALLYATHDSNSVEGSLSADNWGAAKMIRDYAIERRIDGVMNENLATIGKAMNVALRRWGLSRKQRRNMVHGEQVPDDNGNE